MGYDQIGPCGANQIDDEFPCFKCGKELSNGNIKAHALGADY